MLMYFVSVVSIFWFGLTLENNNLLNNPSGLLMYGLLLYTIGLIHSKFERTTVISSALKNIALIFCCGNLFLFTFGFIIEEIKPYNHPLFITIPILSVILALIFALFHNTNNTQIYKFETIGSIALNLLILTTTLTASDPLILTLIYNFLLASVIIGIVFIGFNNKNTSYVNIAIFFFIIDLIARYFDFFFDLLSRSLFFLIGGILLLTIGIFMEKKRKNLVAKMLNN